MNKMFPLAAAIAAMSVYVVSAQTGASEAKPLFKAFESDQFVQFDQDRGHDADGVIEQYASEIGLTPSDKMNLINVNEDALGWTQYRYQREYKGIPVEFATFTIHAKEGKAIKGTGRAAGFVDISTEYSLTEQQALAIALECVGADLYSWESPTLEAQIKNATDDPNATFYPKGELVIADDDFDPRNGAAYSIAWKFEIHAARPSRRDWVYVNAVDGRILKELDLNIHADEHNFTGLAETRYHGLREIVTDSTENGFVLRDRTRGRGIETYDAVDSNSIDHAVDFFDTDNYWSNENDRPDDAATNCHWAAEQLYDYWREVHGFEGYDRQGGKLISYVHYGQNWSNASWNGYWARYGDGSGEPWVNIDVVGHEFTHGFTRLSCGLIYNFESGALNESFSDIMAEALENYSLGENDWLVMASPIDTLRDIVDPARFGNPAYYRDDNWWTGDGGVHTNSAVQNKWFHFLVEGGEGVNYGGDEYAVMPIGMGAAMDIVIRSMTTYLFPDATYADARQASLFSAEDIFGACSDEYRSVANAWHAVGVGERVEENDFAFIGIEEYPICGLSANEPLTIHLKHMGCDSTDSVRISVKLIQSSLASNTIIDEVIEIPEGVGPGELFSYTFSNDLQFNRTGEYTLDFTLSSTTDSTETNNTLAAKKVYRLEPVIEHKFPFYTAFGIRTFRDSMAFQTGDFNSLRINKNFGVDSTVGILIEGGEARNAIPIKEGMDPFDYNERYGAKVCFCVNATDLDSLGLQFDLRQTNTTSFDSLIGLTQAKTSVVRVLANDTELARYVPLTNNDDEWQTHNLDLESFLGLDFTVCFETRTIQNIETDHDSIGDRVFLDNIEIISNEISSSLEFVDQADPLEVFPNPTSGDFTIRFDSESGGKGYLRLIDLNGAEISMREISIVVGENVIPFEAMAIPGIYFVEVNDGSRRYMARLVVAK